MDAQAIGHSLAVDVALPSGLAWLRVAASVHAVQFAGPLVVSAEALASTAAGSTVGTGTGNLA
ncbi:MAG TPA: hypothetical protein VLY23_19340 [Candidatus Acidoferrum sp.]|nr:hypothetical protein [Candidatus Acidoferrum sp.]